MALTTHPHLSLRLKKEQTYTSTLGLHGLLLGELHLCHLFGKNKKKHHELLNISQQTLDHRSQSE
jgi:hypothetical protein